MSGAIPLGVAAGLLALTCTALGALNLVAVSHEVRAAADAAALAGVESQLWMDSHAPCDDVEHVATANATHLVDCVCRGSECLIQVDRDLLGVSLSARARAGPD